MTTVGKTGVEWGHAEDLVLMCRDISRYDHQYSA